MTLIEIRPFADTWLLFGFLWHGGIGGKMSPPMHGHS